MASVLNIKDLTFRWPQASSDLLHIEDFEIKKGEKVFLFGPSGSGKSTLLNLIGGVLTPRSGSLKVLDKELTTMSASEKDLFRGDHMGFIFQMFNLLPYFNPIENVVLPCEFSKLKKEKTGGSEQLHDEARRLLSELKLDADTQNKHVTQLSVGQQQRVATARALIGRPELVIADEPTSALDAGIRDSFLKLLFKECDLYGSTLLFVSHDLALGSQFDKVMALSEINKAAKTSLVEASL